MFTCPDGCTQCASGTTCCLQSSGRYGCCPYPDASCCSDYLHCCPYGYTCNVPYCSRAIEKVETKTQHTFPAKTVRPSPNIDDKLIQFSVKSKQDVSCTDTQTCPSGTTCCKEQTGEYSCCSFPQASCCKDGIHCCPNGFTCDSEQGLCRKNFEIVPMELKKAAKSLPPANIKKNCLAKTKPHIINCTGGVYFCLDGETCCLISPGVYGCCPMVDAVCCNDHKHCCPHNTICNTGDGSCQSSATGQIFEITFKRLAQKHKIIKSILSENKNKCPDNKTVCADDNTCCKSKDKDSYRCCQLKDAVCCEDGTHCCPAGFTCSEGGTVSCVLDVGIFLPCQCFYFKNVCFYISIRTV